MFFLSPRIIAIHAFFFIIFSLSHATLAKDHNNQRWAIFSPAFTEIVFYIDPYEASRRVLLVDEYSLYPEKDIAKAGNLLQPNFEKLLQSKIDTVFIQGQNEKLEKFCAKYHIQYIPLRIETIADIVSAMRKAEYYFQTERSAENRKLFQMRLQSIKKLPPPYFRKGKPYHLKTFIITHFQVSKTASGLFSTGRNTFLHEAVEIAGGKNVFEQKIGWIRLSLDELIQSKPEVVIEFTGGKKFSAVTKKKHRAFWKRWLKKVHVIFIESDYGLKPSPRILNLIRDIRKKFSLLPR